MMVGRKFQMKYTVPDYYHEFKCIASACPATCCAGWQIVIDEKSLKKYRAYRGAFGNRLANSIDWKESAFEQYGKRCAFLNEENLCDIYAEAGPDMLCRTCRRYPRHVEEFDNEREISLSLSCPVVAKMLLDRGQKVCFIEKQNELEEEEEEFDFFLYSALQDCRKLMFRILQNRQEKIELRMATVLALAHDVQNRIDARRIFDIESLLERYDKAGRSEKFCSKLECYREKLPCEKEQSESRHRQYEPEKRQHEFDRPGRNEAFQEHRMNRMRALMQLLDELEVLDETWPRWLSLCRKTLYGKGGREYLRAKAECEKEWQKCGCTWMDTETEQLMVYFLFTYFCGAVYDGDVLSKTKMAVVSTLLLREMEYAKQIELAEQMQPERQMQSVDQMEYAKQIELAEQMQPEKQMQSVNQAGVTKQNCMALTLEERAQIAWRYSRELEHSDLNLNRMEELMSRSDAASFDELMHCIMNEKLIL